MFITLFEAKIGKIAINRLCLCESESNLYYKSKRAKLFVFNFVTRKQIIKISYNNQQLRFNHFYRSRGKFSTRKSKYLYCAVTNNDV